MRVAVVTGGTRGIGLAIARRFARENCAVIAVARNPPSRELPRGILFEPCDVAERGSVDALFGRLGRVDILVNCAGLAGSNALAGDDALWHAIIAANLNGTYYCATAALPLMEDGSGRIINIASVLGLRGVAEQTAYCAAKHGVIGFTRALALALAPRGITVNAICPGWVATDMARARFKELGIDAAAAAASVPTGRLTTPEEIAEAAVFLAGPGAASITGHALPVEGGSLAAP